ncbi:phosphatidylethanolamine-binding protein 4-like isoform X2 [Penaeus japonicus]|uniref:phosphatidylethanolamine-binding protein 4-like isoform X2 n=1 Tax=Penaeus japonicus TaxID=27405 RepID=UPI001C715B88|nr:phosphatidylethanolamine-binding protein 4-like isoform X2 [Penaeus japonicus]
MAVVLAISRVTVFREFSHRSSKMASAWSVGVFFLLQFVLCNLQAPPQDCSSLPHLLVSFEQTTLTDCGTSGPKSLYTNLKNVKYEGAEAGHTYTLVMVDPDAPNHSASQAWLHWILSKVEGSDLQNGNIENGQLTVAYAPPTPPSGKHRYYFYLYEETQQKELPGVDKRGKFNLQQYADANQLVGPVAMNMFVTSFD